jgi:hypothetical protein
MEELEILPRTIQTERPTRPSAPALEA